MSSQDFKPGDLVVCLMSSHGGGYTKDRTYEIKSYRPHARGGRGEVSTTLDDYGSTTNGWVADYFSKATYDYVPTQEGDRDDDI